MCVCECVCVSYDPSCFRLDFPLNISIHSIIYVEAAVALGLVVVRRRRSARYMHSTGYGLLLLMSRGLSRTGRARVCLLDVSASAAKTAEPIKMSVDLWTHVGQRNQI